MSVLKEEKASAAGAAMRDTYERRIDACLVIQVAGNDFTSSNLRLFTAILLPCGWYIRASL